MALVTRTLLRKLLKPAAALSVDGACFWISHKDWSAEVKLNDVVLIAIRACDRRKVPFKLQDFLGRPWDEDGIHVIDLGLVQFYRLETIIPT